MATVTGYTAERMQQIEDNAIVGGNVVGNDLILTRHGGGTINAGNVRGPQGDTGTTGGIADAPSNGSYYVRRNGQWELERVSNAPSDGQTYGLRNGTWTQANRPWTLSFTNSGPTPPPGWATSSLVPGNDWLIHFSGSGNVVNFRARFDRVGSIQTAAAYMTLPTDLRPVMETWTMAHMLDARASYISTGSALVVIGTNGALGAPRAGSTPLTRASIGGSSSQNIQVYQSVTVRYYVSGTFIRSGSDLPATASWV